MQMNWDYIAGFFDGEGYVGWSEGRAGDQAGRGARLVIGQKIKSPLEAIQSFLLQHGCRKPRLYLRPARTPSRNSRAQSDNECWVLSLQNCYDVKVFLSGVVDKLILKREKTIYVLEMINTRKKNHDPLPEQVIADMMRSGYSAASMAKKYKVGSHKISAIRSRFNIPSSGGGGIWFTDAEGLRRRIGFNTTKEERTVDRKRKIVRCPSCSGIMYKNSTICRKCYDRLRSGTLQWSNLPTL